MLFDQHFAGFDTKAFEAFESRKWSSNVFNMERLQVREQMKALGSMLDGTLSGLHRFSWEVTTHTPSVFNARRVDEMVLYFTRNQDERRAIVPLLDRRIALPDQISDAGEHHRHITLGVRMDHESCDVGLMMHSTAWLDVMNLLNRCKVPFERSVFVELLHSLPEDMSVRLGPEHSLPVRDFEAGHVDRLEEMVLNNVFLIFIGRAFSPGETAGKSFAETCETALGALFPVWEFCAWKAASDYLEVADESRKLRQAVQTGTADLKVGTRVRVTSGLFSGRMGEITDLDHKGLVRVLVGKVSIRTDGRSVQVV